MYPLIKEYSLPWPLFLKSCEQKSVEASSIQIHSTNDLNSVEKKQVGIHLCIFNGLPPLLFSLYLSRHLANTVQKRSRSDSTSNQTTLNQRPGRDHRPSRRQETLQENNITDREICRSVTDEELAGDAVVSQVSHLSLSLLQFNINRLFSHASEGLT